MKKIISFSLLIISFSAWSQEHFAGINIARRVGLLNATFNPAESANLFNSYDVTIFNTSLNVSNSKLTFNDIVSSNDLEESLFSGNEPIDMRLDAYIIGPSFMMKKNKWGFGIFTGANVKANLINIDSALGDALTNSNMNSLISSTTIQTLDNQRMNATTWGELGFNLSRSFLDTEKFKFNVGANVKLLFPSSYANVAASKFTGTINNTLGNLELQNAQASLNLAYSGPIGSGFTDANNFDEFFSSGVNGYAVDLGVNFKIIDPDCTNGDYKFNSGLAVRNIGSMTFKSENNVSKNYYLDIQGAESLDLDQFEGVDNIQDIEQILVNSGYVTQTSDVKDFTIKLPTLFTAYADLKLYKKWRISAYTQQKMVDDSDNEFSTTQNSITITPRFSSEDYEFYVPLSSNEISGFSGGFGFRLGGFFVGSGSILTAMINDTKQADIYLGFRAGF